MTTIWQVRNAIKSKLDTLTGTWKVFVADYNYFTTKPTWFPFVMFEPVEMSSVFEDTANNYRNFVFQIAIVQEMTQVSRWIALDILNSCFEEMINAFDKDWTLGGVVEQVDATNWSFGEIDLEKWPALYVTTNLNCRVLVPIT